MKRFDIAGVLVSLTGVVIISLGSPVFAASFPDVPEDNINYSAIEYLDGKGIINGHADGSFKPAGLLNRAEAIKIIVDAFNIEIKDQYDILFPDVKKGDWFFKYVMAGRDAGLIKGYSNGQYKPADSVNLAETLKMVVTATGIKLGLTTTEDVFKDVKSTDWFAPYVLYARDHNVLFSDDFGNVHAGQPMTRAGFAEIIYRMIIVHEKEGEAFPISTNWTTYEGKSFPFTLKYDDSEWKVYENANEIIFHRPDKEFLQFNPHRMYMNSAKITVALDANTQKLTKDQYFKNLKLAFPYALYRDLKVGALSAYEVVYPNDQIMDRYIYLEDGKVLSIYSQYGKGVLKDKLMRYVHAVMESVAYKKISATSNDNSALLNEIFSKVLVEGIGMNTLDKLLKKTIIETDTIGVGTGPVDYYYSEDTDYTFKYERSADVILDSRKGRTSSF